MHKKIFLEIFAIFSLCIFSFALYIFFYIQTPEGEQIIFSSPDETALKVFSEHFAKEGNFFLPRSSVDLPDFVHPRSSAEKFGHLVPMGFLGQFIFYGVLHRIFYIPLIFLTPFFTALAGLALFYLFQIRYTKNQSLFGTTLFLFHPAVIYYTTRGLLPNMLFVDLLIFSVYFLSLFFSHQRKTFLVCGMFLVGLALSVRPVEAGWVGSLLVVFFIWQRKFLHWKLWLIAFFYFSLAFVPLAYYNFDTYGSIIQTGYAQDAGGILPKEFSTEKNNVFFLPFIFIAPFGFHIKNIFFAMWNYAFLLFSPLTALAFFGIVFSKAKIYRIIFIGVSIWLFLLYGSWVVKDNIAGEIGIGVSYVRYWLPIFVLSLPFTIEGCMHLCKKKSSFFWSIGLVGVLFFSIGKAFIFDAEALFAHKSDSLSYYKVREEVRREVPKDAIIISERSDKIFFPEYEVIDVTSDAEPIWKRLKEISDFSRLYYFSIYPPTSIEAVNQKFLYADNFRFEFLKKVEKEYYLYHFISL